MTREEEARLVRKACSQDRATAERAQAQLLEAHRKHFAYTVSRFRVPWRTAEAGVEHIRTADFLAAQAGFLRALLRAGPRFDPSRARLWTFVKRDVFNAVRKAADSREMGPHESLSVENGSLPAEDYERLSEDLSGERQTFYSVSSSREECVSQGQEPTAYSIHLPTALETTIQADQQARISTLLGTLDSRSRLIIQLHYGAGISVHEIANRFGISRQRADKIRVQALRHLHDEALRRGWRTEDFLDTTKRLFRLEDERGISRCRIHQAHKGFHIIIRANWYGGDQGRPYGRLYGRWDGNGYV